MSSSSFADEMQMKWSNSQFSSKVQTLSCVPFASGGSAQSKVVVQQREEVTMGANF